MTKLARQGRLGDIAGREAELRRTIQVLARTTRNNPMLISEAGEGGVEIAAGLARHIVAGEVPETLRNKRLFRLDLDSLRGGLKDTSDFENRLKDVLADAASSKGRIILFIDELQSIGTASDALKDAPQRGDLRCLGTATPIAYENYIENKVGRFFEQIHLGESNNNSFDSAKNEASADTPFEGDKLSTDVRETVQNAGSKAERAHVILQVDDVMSVELRTLLDENGVQINEQLRQLGTLAVELPVSAIAKLAAHDEIVHVFLDREIQSFGHVSQTTGAAYERAQTNAAGASYTLDGSGEHMVNKEAVDATVTVLDRRLRGAPPRIVRHADSRPPRPRSQMMT